MEKETSSGVGPKPNSFGIGAAAGFLLVMAVIGSTAALAWRAHNELASLARAQYADMDEMEKAIRRLELVQGQIAQQVNALQTEQKTEQSRLGEIQLLSEKLTSLQAALEKVTRSGANQEPQRRHSTSGAPSKTQASNLPSGTTP